MTTMKERIELLKASQGIEKDAELLRRAHKFLPSMAKTTLMDISAETRMPRVDSLSAIARALNTTVSYLIGEIDDPTPPGRGRGEALPEILAWSERLRKMDAAQRAKTIQAIESVLGLAEGR